MNNPRYTSHFGVYALIESPDGDEILLIKKTRGPYKGLLDLPGGAPKDTEILEQTLWREVMEETGLDIDSCTQYKTMSSLFECNNNGSHILRHIGVLYRVQASGLLKTEADGHDSNGAVWVKKSDILGRDVTPFVSLYLGK